MWSSYLLVGVKIKKALASGMGTAFSFSCMSESGRGRGPTGISGSSLSSTPAERNKQARNFGICIRHIIPQQFHTHLCITLKKWRWHRPGIVLNLGEINKSKKKDLCSTEKQSTWSAPRAEENRPGLFCGIAFDCFFSFLNEKIAFFNTFS